MNNLKDAKIMKQVQEHYDYLTQLYPPEQILGVFLYGSQNYGTDTENSDVDTKAILVPTLEDLCLSNPVSKEIHLPNDEHCEVKDIREMVKQFRKQNINFIEILFTKYKIINLRYANTWHEYFISQNESIARYDECKCLKSISGQAKHTIRQNPKDGKKISNGLRLSGFLNLYKAGLPYESCLCLNEDERNTLKAIKTGEQIYSESSDYLIGLFEHFEAEADYYLPRIEFQTKVDAKMNEGILKLVKKLIN